MKRNWNNYQPVSKLYGAVLFSCRKCCDADTLDLVIDYNYVRVKL
jgi:hypothetical protein